MPPWLKSGSCYSNIPQRRRQGSSLVEMLVVMAGLGLVMLVGAAMVVALLRLDRATADGMDRLLQLSALADRFRLDVAQAEAAPPSWGKWKAGPSCLILQLAADHHVVYQWQTEWLERKELKGAKVSSLPQAVGSDCLEVTFVSADSPGKIITLGLREQKSVQHPVQTLEIKAMLGGDRR